MTKIVEHLNSVFKVIIEEIRFGHIVNQVDGKSGRSRNGTSKTREIINLAFTNLRKEVGPKCDKERRQDGKNVTTITPISSGKKEV